MGGADSDRRQRVAIAAFAKRAGFTIDGEFFDVAVSGADPVDQRPGFAQMLQQLAANGAKTIIVESPDRFARDLAVQLAGHDMLRGLGISIIPASAPDFFTEDTPPQFWCAKCLAPSLNSRRRVLLQNLQQLANASVSVRTVRDHKARGCRRCSQIAPSQAQGRTTLVA
jgi:hypothetical protein